jgi:hypothetical protein
MTCNPAPSFLALHVRAVSGPGDCPEPNMLGQIGLVRTLIVHNPS